MALVAERKADAKALGLAVGDSIPVLVAKMGSSEQEVDRSSKTDEVPREQRVRLGRSFSEGTSVTSTGGQVSRQASKLFVGLHSQKQKHKNVPSQGDDGYSKIIHSAKGDTYVRRIVAGDTINPLCVLRVSCYNIEMEGSQMLILFKRVNKLGVGSLGGKCVRRRYYPLLRYQRREFYK